MSDHWSAWEPEPEPKHVSLASQEPMLQWFDYAHLPAHLRAISVMFWGLAHELVIALPRNAERTVALRKLLEGKDAAVRAAMAV